MEARRAADLADLTPLTVLGSPVRRRLYELIAEAGRAVDRDEAAAAVGVSRSLAAYHLDKLVEKGLLEASFVRRSDRGGPGGGRPAKLYRRAQREFVLRSPPRDYRLLGDLLVRTAEADRTGTVRAMLDEVAYDYGRSLGELEAQHGAVGRIELMEVLRCRGYEPFDDENGTTRLRNCPFETVARQCPEVVCGLNVCLLEGLIAGLGISGARAVLEPRDGACCVAIASAGH